MCGNNLRSAFSQFAKAASNAAGSVWAFIGAVLIVAVWAIVGVFTGFTDTHQLIINTGTTIITFWMGFIIQSTQNRDSKAIHLKLDELIRTQQQARDVLIDLEDAPDELLQQVQREFNKGE